MGETENNLAFMISLANIFGIFPVSRQKVAGSQQLCFKWKSLQVIHCLTTVMTFSFVNTLFNLRLMIHEGTNFMRFASTVINISTLLETYLFFLLAIQWPSIMKKWNTIDCNMSGYIFPQNFKLKLKLLVAFFCIAALGEHLLFIGFVVTERHSESIRLTEFLQIFVEATSEHLLSVFRYNIFLGVAQKFYSVLSVFCWNFTDLFIISISLLLSTRFYQIAERLKLLARYKIKHEFIWMELRDHHNYLCKFCETMDNAIGTMILISFLNTIFFVVFQLNHIIQLKENAQLVKVLYLMYSFTFVTFRALAVSHFAGTVYSAGRTVREYLNFISHNLCNNEIDRFLGQVQSTRPALTGRKFFRVDDTLIFSVVKTMLSYEIILIQFQIDSNH